MNMYVMCDACQWAEEHHFQHHLQTLSVKGAVHWPKISQHVFKYTKLKLNINSDHIKIKGMDHDFQWIGTAATNVLPAVM
jgi:hypothetical protein